LLATAACASLDGLSSGSPGSSDAAAEVGATSDGGDAAADGNPATDSTTPPTQDSGPDSPVGLEVGPPPFEGCAPKTMAVACAGLECGSVSDGCGGHVSCGSCTAPDSCGAGGQAHVCGCVSMTCGQLGAVCGAVDGGCGTLLECGICPVQEVCSPTHTCAVEACGASGEPCCTGATFPCNAGSVCGPAQVCEPCGAIGEPCCAGTPLPCNAGAVCAPTQLCVACGGAGQPCCSQGVCNSGSLICVGAVMGGLCEPVDGG
jgi:hypothetical protein